MMSKFIDDADNQDEYCRTCGLPPDYDFDALVEHCRALEAMLRKQCEFRCPECGERIAHSPGCGLARLIE